MTSHLPATHGVGNSGHSHECTRRFLTPRHGWEGLVHTPIALTTLVGCEINRIVSGQITLDLAGRRTLIKCHWPRQLCRARQAHLLMHVTWPPIWGPGNYPINKNTLFVQHSMVKESQLHDQEAHSRTLSPLPTVPLDYNFPSFSCFWWIFPLSPSFVTRPVQFYEINNYHPLFINIKWRYEIILIIQFFIFQYVILKYPPLTHLK